MNSFKVNNIVKTYNTSIQFLLIILFITIYLKKEQNRINS